MSAVLHFRSTRVYQAGQPSMNRFARVVLCEEGTVSVSKSDVGAPFDCGSIANEVDSDATAISEPHLTTRQPSYQRRISQLNSSTRKEAWQDGTIDYLPCT